MSELLFGMLAGIIAANGMGGGTILILLLNLLGSIEQHKIQGINLVFFIPTSMMAIFMNVRKKKIDYSIAKTMIIFGMVGAVLGSLLSFQLNNRALKKYFGWFLLGIAAYQIYLFWKEYKSQEKRE